MSENAIPHSQGDNLRPGQELRLTSLAPAFDDEQHQLYYDLLVRAIDAEGTRNIALTGAYGTGKSSVLQRLSETHGARTVQLSLSTIAPDDHDTDAISQNSAEDGPASRTNQIQKEIVKQLLYRLPPEAVPRSRFRRASAPNRRRDWVVAGTIGAAVFIVLLGLGLVQPLVEALLPVLWRQIVAYVLILGLAAGATWAIISVLRSRPTISASVQAGAATVTLSKQSDTYFDEYLDEIVYFFQVSRRNIVVIEDIDRFEDVQVFDTLRALNGLLNSSDQIGQRIVFIYAIRDSVFEKIGAPRRDGKDLTSVIEESDRAKATLKRASRTKFFDVIIPVVPFVSADNARDVMSDAMASDEFTINPALIRLAARHVADMRMIHNIRNEFEVYRNRLVVPASRVPGIDDDLVFAIVLFKNTHLTDFEKIRHRDSTLDLVYNVWRALVRQNLATRAQQLTSYRNSRHLEATKNARATRLGHALLQLREGLQAAAQATAPQATVELTGPVTEGNLDDAETWARIAAGEPQQLQLRDPGTYRAPTINLSFTADQLTEMFGIAVNADGWEAVDLAEVNAAIVKEEQAIDFLRHHTWEELCARPEFKVDTSGLALTDSSGQPLDGAISFDDVVQAALESDLARDLVRHGFLISHFALYSSSYYGNHLGPDAMEYIRRCVEPGIPDASFPMSDTDVVQLLREQDAEDSDTADFLSDASVFNIAIMDYLLSKRPAAAATVARRLSLLGEQEHEFLDTYIAQGEHPARLLAALAPYWPGVLRYAAVTAPVDATVRPALLNAVLQVAPNDEFETDREVGLVIQANYQDMDAICQPVSADHAEIVLRIVKANGGSLESLADLNDAARDIAVQLRIFPLIEANLRALLPTGPIALDTLRPNQDVYAYALDELEDYLDIASTSPLNVQTVADPKMFATVLTEAAKRSSTDLLGQLVDMSGADCQVPALSDTAVQAWPFLARSNRTDPTFENVSEYIDQFGIDEHIGLLLSKHKKITDWQRFPAEKRMEVSIDVLAASSAITSTNTRVRIAASIEPGIIEATRITPETGDLVARLLKRRLLADDATAFSADLMVDWVTLETTIAASKKFETFVSPEVLDVSNIPPLLRSSAILAATRLAVVSSITAYLAGASRLQVRTLASALAENGWGLPYESIEALRTAGATTGQVVALIAARGDRLPVDQLKLLLRALGGDYSRVANGGRGRPTFNVDSAHTYVLNRLVGDTIKQVETETFKLKGPKLVAPLQQASV